MKISEIHDLLTASEQDLVTFQEVKETFQKWLYLSDPSILDIIFGSYLAHHLPGERVWLLIVAASGGVKTEIIRSLELIPDTYPLSNLTGRSLISGTRSKEGEADPSLLPQIDGKVLAIKDFTCLLTLPASQRKEILGTLRDAYDGYTSKSFGNLGTVGYKSRFGLIAGVTPIIDKYHDVETELGERYLKLRIEHTSSKAAIRQALNNSGHEEVMRSEIATIVGKFFIQNFSDQKLSNVSFPATFQDLLIALADVTTTIRSRVPRQWKSEALEYLPNPEVGTRLAKQLSQLAKGVALLRGDTTISNSVFELIKRVALDSVPALRRKVLEALFYFSDFASTEEISEQCGLPTKSVKLILEDFTLFGVTERKTNHKERGKPHVWRLTSEFRHSIESYSNPI